MPPKDDTVTVKRPEWFKWFGAKYLNSVEHWEADQRGWYHKLLVWSAVQGEPAGYLPSDDDELRDIAGFNSLTFSRVFSALASTPDLRLLLEEYNQKQERKWQKVMAKFKQSTDHPGLIYNRRMVEVMQDAMLYQDFRSQGGKKVAAQRREQQALLALDGAPKHAIEFSPEGAVADAVDSARASSSNSSSKAVSKPTLFKEDKFHVTNEMRENLKKKYPELKEEDYQELRDTFCHSRYGQSQISWKRQFYTYVHNQITKYGYIPISQRSNPTAILQNGANRNGHKYESAIAERERLAREEDEHLQRLRSGSHGDSTEGSKSLQLPPFTSNTKR